MQILSSQHHLVTRLSDTGIVEPGPYSLGPAAAAPKTEGRTSIRRTRAHALREQSSPPAYARGRGRGAGHVGRGAGLATTGPSRAPAPPHGPGEEPAPLLPSWGRETPGAQGHRPRPSPRARRKRSGPRRPGLTFRPKTWTLCRGPLAGMTPPARETEAA